MEHLIKQYFNSFFINHNEWEEFSRKIEIPQYNTSDDESWEYALKNIKNLFTDHSLDEFDIEINKNATIFIDKLFANYVDNNTFIIAAPEHRSIENNIKDHKNTIILTQNLIQSFDINSIVAKYQNSGCNKVFVYGAGIIESQIVSYDFYNQLKSVFVDQKIEHTFVLDDVASMFILPKDYSIFDYIIFTCHSLLPNFDSGLLFTKRGNNFGFKDADVLNLFANLLGKYFLAKKDKIYLFNYIIRQYLAPELQNQNLFDVKENCPYNAFYLKIKNDKICTILNKNQDELLKYCVEVHNDMIFIKLNFLFINNSDTILEGLKKFKELLQKAIKIYNRTIL